MTRSVHLLDRGKLRFIGDADDRNERLCLVADTDTIVSRISFVRVIIAAMLRCCLLLLDISFIGINFKITCNIRGVL